jgi:hypothetical protein
VPGSWFCEKVFSEIYFQPYLVSRPAYPAGSLLSYDLFDGIRNEHAGIEISEGLDSAGTGTQDDLSCSRVIKGGLEGSVSDVKMRKGIFSRTGMMARADSMTSNAGFASEFLAIDEHLDGICWRSGVLAGRTSGAISCLEEEAEVDGRRSRSRVRIDYKLR